ncbi:alkanesulfonate monooxygenase SsuD/methylene tetrahydromethanopterin reductase-like flavin-dependent oxidoreductase (luciferase family) [Rhodoligotrophos appendicifer]|uniref:LLM class flavin-dependent oxidoreductase n=1 Tax=Rhodoligotrophos appendicifer TaxID=987056 RepID=UPI001184CAA7|nr:LLM class flavin-dependent oxidoreductase [Rhodoligotrophos appendicifer]
MKLGLFNLMTQRDASTSARTIFEDTMSMVRLADEIGFDVAWFAEHHFSNYSICPSPMLMASYAAGVTKQIRVGAAVLVLPLYNPVRLVQEIGMLDVQSNGRAIIGLGSGYQKYEFDRFNRKLADKTDLMLEIWDMIEMGMREGRIEHHGQHFQVPNSPIDLQTMQKGGPEIYVTGLDPRILQRVARGGHVPFITAGWKGLPVLREMVAQVRAQYAAVGIGPERVPLGVQQYVFVTDDKAEALEMAERARVVARIVTAMRAGVPELEGHFIKAPPMPDEPPVETIRDNLIFGDAHMVAERLCAEIRELGTTHLSCFMQIGTVPGAKARASMERFGRDVIPLMEKNFGMPLAQVHAERGRERPVRIAA